MLTSCPLRYVSRQIEHSDAVSPFDNVGDCDGDKHIVTGDEVLFSILLNIVCITKSTFGFGSSLIIPTGFEDLFRIR
jgi:hypothetical protein